MADQMATDNETGTVVLGRTDNSDIMPDVDYEISLYLSNKGYGEIWEKVCDESWAGLIPTLALCLLGEQRQSSCW